MTVEHSPLTLILAAGAANDAHRILTEKSASADVSAVPRPVAVDLIVCGWLAGAQMMANQVADHFDAAPEQKTVHLDTIPETAEERVALADLDIMNCHGVAASAGHPPVFAMLMPPSRNTQMTPEQALVLAAWLVALADPYSKVKFDHVLRKVHNT